MPLYEYTCLECGEQFEKLVRLSEADRPVTCPQCHSTNCHKSISLFGTSKPSAGVNASSAASCAPSG
jgi:putative FmdB family regulatory protein